VDSPSADLKRPVGDGAASLTASIVDVKINAAVLHDHHFLQRAMALERRAIMVPKVVMFVLLIVSICACAGHPMIGSLASPSSSEDKYLR
jgi:hypothetical protein